MKRSGKFYMSDRISLPSRWNIKEKLLFLEQLEMYVSAGLSLDESLSLIGDKLRGRRRTQLERLGRAIESGQSLSQLISGLGFSDAISGLISCGESSGNLSGMLRAGYVLLARHDELFKRCTSAMVYPAVIALATITLTIALVRGIMPQIIPLLSSLHSDLPFLTRLVMYASRELTAYGLFGAVGSVVMAVGVAALYRKIRMIRSGVQGLVVRLPILGNLVLNVNRSMFLRSLGVLIDSGVPLDRAYERTARSIALVPLNRKLMALVHSVKSGESLSDLLGGAVPAFATSLIRAGEISGHLGGVLIKTADIIDRDLEHIIKQLTSLLEPIMMIGMGGMVGTVALSIMMPIYDISKAIR